MKKISSLLLLLVLVSSAFAGGGWTKAPKKGYFKLGQYWLVADKHFTDTGLFDPNVTTGVFITSVYGEYGIAPRWELQAYLPLLARNYTNNVRSATTGDLIQAGEAINTIGDIDLRIKYGLLNTTKVVLAPSLLLGLPTGKNGGGSQGNLQTGDGEFNVYPRVDASTAHRIFEQTVYASAYGGYNLRSNNYSDEVRWGGEIGIGLIEDRFWFNFKVDNVTSQKNGLPPSESVGTGIFANNTEFTALTYEGAIYVDKAKKWGVSASYSTARNAKLILAAPSYNVGVFYDLK